MTRSPVVRVAVVSADGRSSGTWRIWVARDDVYLALRDLVSVIKVSLHPHQWRCAYTQAHPRGPDDFLPEGHDRCVFRFNKPPFEEGVQFAFAIGITLDGLAPATVHRDTTVLPMPTGEDVMKVLRIYITEPGRTEADLGLTQFELVPPGPLQLQNRRRVWVVATEEEAPSSSDQALGPPVASAILFRQYTPPLYTAPGLVQVGARLSSD